MISKIRKTCGKDVIIIDDWSGHNMRNLTSCPGISLKRKLKQYFRLYLIGEYRTSCLHYLTEKYMKNLCKIERKI
jgi:hypothetical protein